MKRTHKGVGKWPYKALCKTPMKFHPYMRIRGWKGVDCTRCKKEARNHPKLMRSLIKWAVASSQEESEK